MSQHYTRNTTGVLQWCNVCGKMTLHRVYDRRVGSCENSHVRVVEKKKPVVTDSEQDSLF